ncbi:MAG TPA: HAMP domain-containing sensor histidine kinase [Kofleriaceae bacterium]|nr:HAMP domain-containing sensor histidine kinase [Kofleriaceae bacterium]
MAPEPTTVELEHGIPLFLDQLIGALRAEIGAPLEGSSRLPPEIGSSATSHGNELLQSGYTVDQVVHDYGDLCQSVTELAAESKSTITVDEFRTFNRCLDNAIADAVTEFSRQRDMMISIQGEHALNERLGMLGHELRNLLNAALLAFDVLKTGQVAVMGATGALLDRSLISLRALIDRSLADVRLSEGLAVQRSPFNVRDFLEECAISAALDARSRGITFEVSEIDRQLTVDGDHLMMGSAVSNLLQNAIKFSRPHGKVTLEVRSMGDRVLIDVRDECGCLPPGKAEELFEPFKQRSSDRSGLGLGLSISRRAVEANRGTLTVRNIAGTGCVFTIDLPRSTGN